MVDQSHTQIHKIQCKAPDVRYRVNAKQSHQFSSVSPIAHSDRSRRIHKYRQLPSTVLSRHIFTVVITCQRARITSITHWSALTLSLPWILRNSFRNCNKAVCTSSIRWNAVSPMIGIIRRDLLTFVACWILCCTTNVDEVSIFEPFFKNL